jgi:hypothetical protein
MTDGTIIIRGTRAFPDITELRDEIVICRTIGHSWDDNPGGQIDGPLARTSAGVLLLRCTRCTTERFDYINVQMLVFQRYYRYVDGYRSIPGQGTRPNLRGELLRRSVLIRKYGMEASPRKRARKNANRTN